MTFAQKKNSKTVFLLNTRVEAVNIKFLYHVFKTPLKVLSLSNAKHHTQNFVSKMTEL